MFYPATMLPLADPRSALVALVFGLILGLGLGRQPQDRTPVLSAGLAATVVGIVAWVFAADGSYSELATAGMSLALGGAVASVIVALWGRR